MRPLTIYEHPELPKIAKADFFSVGYKEFSGRDSRQWEPSALGSNWRGLITRLIKSTGGCTSTSPYRILFDDQLSLLESSEGTVDDSQNFFIHSTASDDELSRRIDRLLTLKYNWDGEGANPPSILAANSARLICKELPSDIKITDIEADVIGGIILWVEPRTAPKSDSEKLAWFAVRNSGRVMLTCDVHRQDGFLSVDDVTDFNLAAQKIGDFFGK